jgi:hypothetical protein
MKPHPSFLLALALASSSAFAQPSTTAPAVAVSTGEQAAAPVPLSQPVLDHLAGMTPIFDGKTLDGWIQSPPAALRLSAEDFTDLAGFAKKVSSKADAVSSFLNDQFDDAGKKAADGYVPTAANVKTLNSALTKNLGRIIMGPSIYDETRFKAVSLRAETKQLLEKSPTGMELSRLNRLLLEDAYPQEIAKSASASWVVKEGAMASTGGGRGTIYTANDYTHYRLVFSIRHVSGKAGSDHQPCVLIFCQRPAAGEPGLDALGGIQFQVPNGGHWDYRPGHNDGGLGFVNPIKTKYDNHEWRQVEILVNAKEGVARMAVAPAIGTQGIENLVFKDAAAGRTGPIAWQMHNAGLIDEFKDVRIEIDPKDDRLITAE